MPAAKVSPTDEERITQIFKRCIEEHDPRVADLISCEKLRMQTIPHYLESGDLILRKKDNARSKEWSEMRLIYINQTDIAISHVQCQKCNAVLYHK